MKFKTNRLILIGIAILILSSLTACSGADEHIWLKSPGWSRAVLLGNTVLSDPVPMTLDEDGNTILDLDKLKKDRKLNNAIDILKDEKLMELSSMNNYFVFKKL